MLVSRAGLEPATLCLKVESGVCDVLRRRWITCSVTAPYKNFFKYTGRPLVMIFHMDSPQKSPQSERTSWSIPPLQLFSPAAHSVCPTLGGERRRMDKLFDAGKTGLAKRGETI